MAFGIESSTSTPSILPSYGKLDQSNNGELVKFTVTGKNKLEVGEVIDFKCPITVVSGATLTPNLKTITMNTDASHGQTLKIEGESEGERRLSSSQRGRRLAASSTGDLTVTSNKISVNITDNPEYELKTLTNDIEFKIAADSDESIAFPFVSTNGATFYECFFKSSSNEVGSVKFDVTAKTPVKTDGSEDVYSGFICRGSGADDEMYTPLALFITAASMPVDVASTYKIEIEYDASLSLESGVTEIPIYSSLSSDAKATLSTDGKTVTITGITIDADGGTDLDVIIPANNKDISSIRGFKIYQEDSTYSSVKNVFFGGSTDFLGSATDGTAGNYGNATLVVGKNDASFTTATTSDSPSPVLLVDEYTTLSAPKGYDLSDVTISGMNKLLTYNDAEVSMIVFKGVTGDGIEINNIKTPPTQAYSDALDLNLKNNAANNLTGGCTGASLINVTLNAGAITSISVSPNSFETANIDNLDTSITVSFTISSAIAEGGEILVDLESGYDLTAPAFTCTVSGVTQGTCAGGADGKATISDVTADAGSSVSVTLNNVILPGSAASDAEIITSITTKGLASDGTLQTIDTETNPDNLPNVDITEASSVTPGTSSIGTFSPYPNFEGATNADLYFEATFTKKLLKGSGVEVSAGNNASFTGNSGKDYCWSNVKFSTCTILAGKVSFTMEEEVASGATWKLYVDNIYNLPPVLGLEEKASIKVTYGSETIIQDTADSITRYEIKKTYSTTLTAQEATVEPSNVGEYATYTFTVTSSININSGYEIYIDFPQASFDPLVAGKVDNCDYYRRFFIKCKVGGNVEKCKSDHWTVVITISSELVKDTEIAIEISNVLNPATAGEVSGFAMYVKDSEESLIMSQSDLGKVTLTALPSLIELKEVTASTQNAGEKATLTVEFIITNNITATDSLHVHFPDPFELELAGLSGTTSCVTYYYDSDSFQQDKWVVITNNDCTVSGKVATQILAEYAAADRNWLKVEISDVPLPSSGYTRSPTEDTFFIGEIDLVRETDYGTYDLWTRDFMISITNTDNEVTYKSSSTLDNAYIGLKGASEDPPVVCSECKYEFILDSGICYIPCEPACKNCDYPNQVCLECVENAEKNTEGVCECSEGFEIGSSGNTCYQECNELCLNCLDGKCTQCSPLSELESQNTCGCVDNASQQQGASQCTCNSGYEAASDNCVSCRNYFEPSEVSAYFSEKYTKILVKFSAESSTSYFSCQNLIDESSLEKLGQNPKCAWENSTMMVVSLGSNFTIREEPLKLNAFNILKKQGECSFDYSDLEPVAEYKYPLPTPSAKLSAPYSYSIPCASKPLEISAEKSTGRAGGSLSYDWSQLSGPSNIDLSSQTGSVLSIPKTQLSGGDYTFRVSISNTFERPDSADISVKVEEGEALSLTIDAGNQISIKTGNSLRIKAFVESSCGEGLSVQYAWNYEGLSSGGEAPGNPSAVIGNSRQSHVLRIKERDLEAGYTYVFKATAQERENYGEAFLNVTVESSPLVAVLKKTDGQISNGKDLRLDASESYDPDNSQGSLEFEWTCTEPGKDFCESTSGQQLLDTEQTGSILQIESEELRPGAFYYFCVKVSKDTREDQNCVELEVVEMGDKEIKVPKPLFKINYLWELLVLLSVQGSLEDSVQWTQVLGPSLTPTTPLNNPYIYFPPESMTPGSYYSWQATLSSSTGSLTITVPWNTNVGPSCLGDLEVSPSSGSALSTDFELSITDCFDGDEEDYPLFYSFGLVRNGYYIPLAPPRLSNKVTTKLLPGTNTLFAIVCDSMSDCEYYTRSFTVGPVSRRLQEKSVSETLLEDIKHPELIPGTLLIYCESMELEQEDIETAISKLKEFLQELEDIDKATYSNAIGATSAIMGEENTNDSQALELLDLTLFVMDFEVEIIKEDAQLLMESAKTLTQKFSLNSEVLKKSQELISKVFNKYFKNSPPGNQPNKIQVEDVATYRMTETPEKFKNTTFSIFDSNVTLPESLPFSNSTVVDLELTSYKQEGNYSDMVDLSFFTGGSYSGFDLQIEERSLYSLEDLSEPIGIEVLLRNESEVENWVCKYLKDGNWVEEGCEIAELKGNSAVIEVTHTSMFRLESAPAKVVVTPDTDPVVQESEDCSQNYAPLYLMTAVSGVGIVLAVLLLVIGRKSGYTEVVQSVPDTRKSEGNAEGDGFETEKYTARNEAPNFKTSKKQQFLLSHLTLGILRVPKGLRVIRIVCVISELFILGCLIGAFTAAFQETDSEDKQEKDFGEAEIGIMFLAMAITSIILGGVEAVMKVCNSIKARLGLLIGMLVFAFASFGVTGYMCSEFCEVWSLLWTYSYLLGIALEILLCQSMRALVHTLSTKALN